MGSRFSHLLRARSDAIRSQWEALLRVEYVSGPLANPDVLIYLIPGSLEKILSAVAKASRMSVSLQAAKLCVPRCECGNNPYSAYFIAAEQALAEAAVLVQSELPAPARRKSDIAAVMLAVRRLARAEIDAFCGACSCRKIAPRCRHAMAVG